MNVLIDRLRACHVLFPSFNGERDAKVLRLIIEEFIRQLQGWTNDEINLAFDRHIATLRRFPMPADIIAAVEPVKLYRFDSGPFGYGALYAPADPYTASQIGAGFDVESRAVWVDPDDYRKNGVNATPLPLPPDGSVPSLSGRTAASISGGQRSQVAAIRGKVAGDGALRAHGLLNGSPAE